MFGNGPGTTQDMCLIKCYNMSGSISCGLGRGLQTLWSGMLRLLIPIAACVKSEFAAQHRSLKREHNCSLPWVQSLVGELDGAAARFESCSLEVALKVNKAHKHFMMEAGSYNLSGCQSKGPTQCRYR